MKFLSFPQDLEGHSVNHDEIFSLIKNFSGINLNDVHRRFLSNYVNNRTAQLGEDFKNYIKMLQSDSTEMSLLINEAAINETYFFREQRQFEFLRNKYLSSHEGEQLKIWSAACSTGEEAVSLYTLCKSCGVDADIYATDIDTAALDILRKGVYSPKSFRVDGSLFKSLIDKNSVLEEDGRHFSIKEDVRNHIFPSYYNHARGGILPFTRESLDIIFLRNIFIYFDSDLQIRILNNLAMSLKKDGILFLSVNEIPSIACNGTIPFRKEHSDDVFYLKRI